MFDIFFFCFGENEIIIFNVYLYNIWEIVFYFSFVFIGYGRIKIGLINYFKFLNIIFRLIINE